MDQHDAIKIDPREISIEADCEDLAVVVHYIAVHVDEKPPSRRREKKKVKLRKTLRPSSSASKVASEILKKCRYIHESKREDLERVIQELQHQLIREELRVTTQEAAGGWWKQRDSISEVEDGSDMSQEPEMSQLEDYIELLYEGSDKDDMGQKIKGTAMIVRLCTNVENLEALIQDHTLMGALTRVLQEEYKKSVELCYNILRCFLSFSNFAEMHHILSNYKVGSLTLRILELEVKRAEHREDERAKRNAIFEEESKQSPDLEEKIRISRQREDAKDILLVKQQDKLAFVCFHILINLAEDPVVEHKMAKRNIIPYLGAFLGRTSLNVLYLAVTFLKKLSIFDENKDACKDVEIVPKLAKIVPCSCEPLTIMTLRLLYNLSFDAELRDQMANAGVLPKLTELLKKPAYRARCLRLLYHLSIDDRSKSMLGYTEAVPIVCQLVLNFPDKMLPKELAALAINMSLNARCAEKMAAQRGLQHLVDRAVDTADPNLMKVIRNISQWTFRLQQTMTNPEREYKHRHLWQPVIEPLLDLALATDDQALLVEVLGILGNITNLDFPKGVTWGDALQTYDITSFVLKYLVPGLAQNDVVLELVILVGSLAQDPQAAVQLQSANIIRSLETVWIEKNDDVEIQLQLLHTFWWFLASEQTREDILYGTRCVAAMLEALDSPNPFIKREADECLDLVLEFDRLDDGSVGEMGERVKRRRFHVHNKEWLQTTGIFSAGNAADAVADESKYADLYFDSSMDEGYDVSRPESLQDASWDSRAQAY